jgi:ATP-dependent Clp protease ATP-binding subunit ClpA
MFERFTERARQVVVLAQDEARALKHNYIGTEHILLGLLREEEGLAARVLDSLDIRVEDVRARVALIVGRGDEPPTGEIPFTPRAKKVLELAHRETLSLGDRRIGTEHILLGLLGETEGVAAGILREFDADPRTVRTAIFSLLTGEEARPSTGFPGPESTVGTPEPEVGLSTATRALLDDARRCARRDGRLVIGGEHLLIGVAGPVGPAREALAAVGLDRSSLVAAAGAIRSGVDVRRSAGVTSAQARRILELARAEARAAGRGLVEPEDVLLGLLDETASPATRLLFGIGEPADALRRAVLEASREPGDPEAL